MPQDYNNTINLPSTQFPMRASLPTREPQMLEQWDKQRLYYKMVENNDGKPLFTFHDGPPYANAAIHLGTALNKVLKDIIVRYKSIAGFKVAYVPGWDTHGLPIELRAIEDAGIEILQDHLKLRKHCKQFALSHVERQKEQFKRLGTLADYDRPYLTLHPDYVARQIEVFGAMAEKDYIYKDLKTVYWCPECVTALAEAEIEYADDPVDSIYVKFEITEDKNDVLGKMGAELGKTYMVIWTTTTWTIPANMATALGPDFEYVAVKANGEFYILAKDLAEATMQAAGIEDYEVLGSATGKELEFVRYRHPFLDRVSPVIVGDHVTLESGTGAVHTAPGHGEEDFDVCSKFYPEIEVIVPVDENGNMTAEAGDFIQGKSTKAANKLILEQLKSTGNLLAVQNIVHQYPHCWRCKEPVLFRATKQWFCSVEDFKQETLDQISKVEFIPEWGRIRMNNMVSDRSAWCISRQRVWGVPIPVFYCDDCEKYVVNNETIKIVADLFRAEGPDTWYAKSAAEILPESFACPHCGGSHFTKETDTMDVWFDSGTSYASVSKYWENQSLPFDLYLEGSDQFRGWFQSSLLTSVASSGVAPYKTVCTHGMVVDGDGRKMSKSLGNGIDPGEIVGQYGADVLRLWVASSDYHSDIRISGDILKQLSEVYRKIRNTARFILGNLDGFNPETDQVEDAQLLELDRWALTRLDELIAKARPAYDRYDFHIIYHALHNFCTVDMSNFYLDVIKDRLYCEGTESVERRSAQTAMYRILRTMDMLLAPILCFTADEIWSFLPADKAYNAESVMFNQLPDVSTDIDAALMQKWDRIIAVRNDVNKALETARAAKIIGKSLEAKVQLYCDGELYDFLDSQKDILSTVFIVSDMELTKDGTGEFTGELEGLSLTVSPAEGEKCERCWQVSETVGANHNHSTLCDRCADVVESSN